MGVPELFGLVLSGGRSERMGTDKGWLAIHGISQREFVFNLLSGVCTRVFTSCNIDQQIGSNLNPIVDRYPVRGPLNGILSAFHEYPTNAFFAIAVDMPAITKRALQLLISNRDPSKLATCYYNSDKSWPEPLLTIWEPSAYPSLVKFYATDESPMKFLRTHDVCMVQVRSTAIFRNVNTPEELRAKGWQARGGAAICDLPGGKKVATDSKTKIYHPHRDTSS
jgi:molybdenum cofactor guanylyltransferase